MYTVLSDGQVISATKNFNESLEQQWLTTDALMGALTDYADASTDIGARATEAATKVRTFTQVIEVTKEAPSNLVGRYLLNIYLVIMMKQPSFGLGYQMLLLALLQILVIQGTKY